MYYSGTMKVNERGNLELGGCDLVELAKKHGTPLNVLDEEGMRESCKKYNDAFQDNYSNYRIIYAGKAFLNRTICRIIEEEGLGLDVVSGGELYVAINAGFPGERIYFHGNNKSKEELLMALEYGVGRIVVDNFYELEMLKEISKEKEKKIDVYLRVTPGIDAKTHDYIKTGTEDSKFGFNITEDGIWKAVGFINSNERINLKGLHCHLGSQIFEKTPFELAARTMMNLMVQIKTEFGLELGELDLGGGMGIRYTGKEEIEEVRNIVEAITTIINEISYSKNFPLPKLMVEPGRCIVGEAGVMLYTVGSIKEIQGIRKYISVDGGMSDNIRPALYNASYTAAIANKADKPGKEKVTIAGKACESGDILIKDISLPRILPGDILAILSCGAYTYSMASNYNLLTRPEVVIVNNGQSDVIIRRETYEDLIGKDFVPERFNKIRI